MGDVHARQDVSVDYAAATEFGRRHPRLSGLILFLIVALPMTAYGAVVEVPNARPLIVLGAIASGLLVCLLVLVGDGRRLWQTALMVVYGVVVVVAMGGRNSGVGPFTGAAFLSLGTFFMFIGLLFMAGARMPPPDGDPAAIP